jgi:oxaloacetate decarboxylase alpha subunit
MGYPPLVTPTSQIVGAQAVLNVLMGRYKIISKETRDLVEGRYGRLPGPVDQDLRIRVLSGRESITVRPADLIEPEWDKVKSGSAGKAFTDEDAMVFGLFPQVAEQYMKKRGTPPEENNRKEKPQAANPAAVPASRQ